MVSTLLAGPVLSLLCAAAPVIPAPTAVEKAAERKITDGSIRAHVRFLASDALGGRGPATAGDTLAQQYIAAEFESLGLRPGAPDGSWYQPFDIVGIEGNPQTLSLNGGGKKLSLRYADEFIAVAGAQRPESVLDNAELVFVGYGIVAPEYQWDDYKGVDLKGKVLVMMNSDPESSEALFAGKTRLWYGRWDYKYEIAAKMGAAGAIIIHTTPSAGYPWQVVRTSWAGEQFELPAEAGHRLEVKAWVTDDAAKRLVALTGKDLNALRASAEKRDFKPVPLGVTVTTKFKNQVTRKRTANVLGVLPGASESKGVKEAVLYTAHHDHLGTKPNAKPGEDAIYNGAVDNASGVATMLSVARAFSDLPKSPTRSILFAAVAAEEQGLLGSEYLANHLPFPAGAIAADINLDGANTHGRTRDVTMIGMGKSNLDAWVVALAKEQGRVVKPDQLSDRGFFYRSDQFNFAKLGIPAAYFGSGMEFLGRPDGWGRKQREAWEDAHYHQPSDELRDDWDLSGAIEDARLYFRLGLALARVRTLPSWNPGDEFEDARKKSLEALRLGQSNSSVGAKPASPKAAPAAKP